MALNTIGTAANNQLAGFVVGTNDYTDPDAGTLRAAILDDQINTHPVFPGAYEKRGMLFVPNRGHLKVFAGDIIAVDPTTGWPILISKLAAAGASWVHVP